MATTATPVAKSKAAPKTAAKTPVKAKAATAGRTAAAPAKAVTKSVETVSLKAVFEHLAETHEIPKKQAQAIGSGMVDLMTALLKKGDRVRITGLGILEVKDRAARTGRNPRTGEVVQIVASKKVVFRVAKELKESV